MIDRDRLFKLLDEFQIETPSWGYADTGTRFGKFVQPAAAGTIEEKATRRRDRPQVHGLLSDGGRARVVGFQSRRRRHGDGKDRREEWRKDRLHQPQRFSRTRSTSSAAPPAPTSAPAIMPAATDGLHQHRARGREQAVEPLVRRRHELSRPGRHRQPQAAYARRPSPVARRDAQRHDDARRIQTLRTGVLSHRHRRLGHGLRLRQRSRPARRKSWSTPATTCPAATSSTFVAYLSRRRKC